MTDSKRGFPGLGECMVELSPAGDGSFRQGFAGDVFNTLWYAAHVLGPEWQVRFQTALGRDGELAPFGGNGGEVEVDETFIGKEPGVAKAKDARDGSHKMKMLTLVDRDTKRARSRVVDDLTKATILPILRDKLSREAFILTDEARQYQRLATSLDFGGHDWVNHSRDEYVRPGFPDVHTNTVEGVYSTFKRDMWPARRMCGALLASPNPGRACGTLVGAAGHLSTSGGPRQLRVTPARWPRAPARAPAGRGPGRPVRRSCHAPPGPDSRSHPAPCHA